MDINKKFNEFKSSHSMTDEEREERSLYKEFLASELKAVCDHSRYEMFEDYNRVCLDCGHYETT